MKNWKWRPHDTMAIEMYNVVVVLAGEDVCFWKIWGNLNGVYNSISPNYWKTFDILRESLAACFVTWGLHFVATYINLVGGYKFILFLFLFCFYQTLRGKWRHEINDKQTTDVWCKKVKFWDRPINFVF